jgi:hypothetical protein
VKASSNGGQDAQPVVDEQELSNYARRFLLVWGALSVLAFLLSAALTASLVSVPSKEAPYNPVGMYGDYGDSAVGWIYYYDTSLNVGSYLIYYPPRTKFVALPFGRLGGCDENRPVQRTLPPANITTSQYEGHKYYVVALSNLPHGSASAGKTTCRIDFNPTPDSYIGYAIDFWFLPSLPNGPTPIATLNYSITIDGTDNMQVFGAKSTSSSSVALEPDDETIFKFTQIRRESLRDIMLVLIGAFVALGAATALEAIRPYVELFANRKR